MNRVTAAFRRLAKSKRAAFMPFIAAGDPDLDTTAAVLRALQDRGAADLVELGVPFSDPIADGPVIQAAFQRALDGGVTPHGILDRVRTLRDGGLELPICLMTSFSLVYRPGVEAFVAAAAEAGIDGMIVPDLPVDEAGPLADALAARGMVSVPLIAPTTPDARREKVFDSATGFIYCVSVAGITGERAALPKTLDAYVRGVKKRAKVPVCVGFGISTPAHVAAVAKAADGVIVGSAIVRRMADAAGRSPDEVAAAVADFCLELAAPLGK